MKTVNIVLSTIGSFLAMILSLVFIIASINYFNTFMALICTIVFFISTTTFIFSFFYKNYDLKSYYMNLISLVLNIFIIILFITLLNYFYFIPCILTIVGNVFGIVNYNNFHSHKMA